MEKEKKEIWAQITLDAEAITEFMMYQIYTGGAGIAVLALGALNAGLAVAFGIRREWFMMLLFAVFALLLFFGFPAVIKNRVSVLQGQKKFVKPVEYIFDQEGIRTMAAEREKRVPWENVKKAVSRKHTLPLVWTGVEITQSFLPPATTSFGHLIFTSKPHKVLRALATESPATSVTIDADWGWIAGRRMRVMAIF